MPDTSEHDEVMLSIIVLINVRSRKILSSHSVSDIITTIFSILSRGSLKNSVFVYSRIRIHVVYNRNLSFLSTAISTFNEWMNSLCIWNIRHRNENIQAVEPYGDYPR